MSEMLLGECASHSIQGIEKTFIQHSRYKSFTGGHCNQPVKLFRKKKLDVDLKTTRTPMPDRRTYIALPSDGMRARLGCWTVRQCYWEYWECIDLKRDEMSQWFLKFDLKRDDHFVEGELAELMVELRSDVIGARKPVEPLATFTRGGIQNIFGTFAFGPFHFKAYKKDGRIRGDFQLRITIWEETS